MEEKIVTFMKSYDFIRKICEKTGIRFEGISSFRINAPVNEHVRLEILYTSEDIAKACIDEVEIGTDDLK